MLQRSAGQRSSYSPRQPGTRMQLQLKAMNIELLESYRVFLKFNSVIWKIFQILTITPNKDTTITRFVMWGKCISSGLGGSSGFKQTDKKNVWL